MLTTKLMGVDHLNNQVNNGQASTSISLLPLESIGCCTRINCAIPDCSWFAVLFLKMLVSLTVGKVDAGVAVLLTQDNRLVSSHLSQHNDCHPTRTCASSTSRNPALESQDHCRTGKGLLEDSQSLIRAIYRSNSPPSFSRTTSHPAALSTLQYRATTPPKLRALLPSRRYRSGFSTPTA
jgi:hypothetical protein